MSKRTLSIALITQNERFDARRWLANMSPVADELLIVDGGSTDDRRAILGADPKTRIVERTFDNFTNQKNFAFSQCRSDWILMVDSDELLSDRLREAIPGLIGAWCLDYWKILRIWLVSLDPPRYVRSHHLVSDYEIRLFRNKPNFRYPTGRGVHHIFDKETRGRGKKYRGGAILHLDFVFNDRAAREAKVAKYARMDPESHARGLNAGYLFEDDPYEFVLLDDPCAELPGSPGKP
jgi:glycosyltransferase involved in cell wall biosynthesis